MAAAKRPLSFDGEELTVPTKRVNAVAALPEMPSKSDARGPT